MMRQYWEFKARYSDSLLFFRLGDFYELFFDDAEKASRMLGLTLTSRGGGGGVKAPMCGVPYHSAQNYIAKLLKAGEKVAICEQVEDPQKAKGLVKRDVIRVLTPGTVMEGNMLEERANNYIAALSPGPVPLGLAYADLSTGEFRATSFSGNRAAEEARHELTRIGPSECLVPREVLAFLTPAGTHVTVLEAPPSAAEAREILLRQFEVPSLAAFGCENDAAVQQAAAALLKYMAGSRKTELKHFNSLRTYTPSSYLRLDQFTIDALEVVPGGRPGEAGPTLLSVLDSTVTAPGARTLRTWLLRPLADAGAINARLDAVSWFADNDQTREKFRALAGNLPDLERIAGRLGGQGANARDLAAVGGGLGILREIKSLLDSAGASGLVAGQAADFAGIPELEELLARAIADSPPLALTEGDIIRDGYNAGVDELRQLSAHGKVKLMEVQARERERSGIDNLRVLYNNVFGYFIEVSKGKAGKVPADYLRKQTLTGAERFITPELKELEGKILGAKERLEKLEYDLFTEVRDRAAAHVSSLLRAGRAAGTIDVLASFAETSCKQGYARPVIDQEGKFEISEGRHPVLERLVSPFVSNDLRLAPGEETVMVITGPNMAGKSTYLRQNALIALMAHAGCFVPAKSARVGLFDGIYCRIGASDRLTRGQSTFMVEMSEVVHILSHATKRSLLVFDEVGRGTSTYDGISIAWAILEYVAEVTGASTFFATHYYELTALAGRVPGVRNYNVLVREWKNELIFLYKIVPGRADRSYGVQVAKLAGLPATILARAREMLKTFEKSKLEAQQQESGQLGLFTRAQEEIADILRETDPERMTPVQALALLADLRERAGPGPGAGEGNA